jgi:hypothetical protein
MDRIYPFKRKTKVGKDRWYEKIGLTYTSDMRNLVKGHQDSLFKEENLDNFLTSFRHRFGLNTSYKLLKVLSWQPYVNYTENWELNQINRYWDPTDSLVKQDTLQKFGRYGTWNTGMNFSTKIYGMYTYRGGPIKAIRHVMTPVVGLQYDPDYRNRAYVKEVYGYNDSLLQTYSIYDGSVSAYNATDPNGKERGSLSFELRNNVEMKVKSRKDTVKGEKKIKLLDQLNFRSAYDLFADSMNWSNVSIVANTNLFNFFRINYNSQLNLYALDSVLVGENKVYKQINQFQYDKNGQIGRFTNHRLGVNFTLSNKKQQERKREKLQKQKNSPYVYQNIAWTLSVGYTYQYDKPLDEKRETQSLSLQGTLQLTKNWKFEGMTNYDFENNDFGYTRFSLYRDMNCWEARISVVPKGGQQNYNFSINLKPSMFKDLKVERKRNFYDF